MKTDIELKPHKPDLMLNFDWHGHRIQITFSGYMDVPLDFVQELQRRWNAGETTT